MSNILLKTITATGIGLTMSWHATAASIHGTLSFDKRAPYGALVFVPSSSQGSQRVEIDQVDKTFTTAIAVNAPGKAVVFKNSDNMDHNVYANDIRNNARFDVGLMSPGGTREVEASWQDDALIRIGCKIHPKMRAYIANINSEHFSVIEMDKTEQTYRFTLNDVPSNTRAIKVLIPGYDDLELHLDSQIAAPIDITKKNKRRGQITLTTEGLK